MKFTRYAPIDRLIIDSIRYYSTLLLGLAIAINSLR